MGYPIILASSSGGTTVNATTTTITYPAGTPAPGDLLLVFLAPDQNVVTTWPGGDADTYTPILAQANGTLVRLEARYRVATGAEGPSFAVAHTTNMLSYVTLRIQAGTWDPARAIEFATAISTGASLDPPGLDPAGWPVGTEVLWLAVGAHDDGTTTFTTDAPTGYTHVNKGQPASGQSTGTCVASRHSPYTGAAENPNSAMTLSASEPWVAATLAIPPWPVGTVVLDAESGVYSVAGTPAAIARGFTFTAEPGVYAVTGAPAIVDLDLSTTTWMMLCQLYDEKITYWAGINDATQTITHLRCLNMSPFFVGALLDDGVESVWIWVFPSYATEPVTLHWDEIQPVGPGAMQHPDTPTFQTRFDLA